MYRLMSHPFIYRLFHFSIWPSFNLFWKQTAWGPSFIFFPSAKIYLCLSSHCVMIRTAEPHMYTSETSAFQHIWAIQGLRKFFFFYTCRAFRSLSARSSMVWMVLLCNINNSKLSRPDSSCSFRTVRLLYLKRLKQHVWNALKLHIICLNCLKKNAWNHTLLPWNVHKRKKLYGSTDLYFEGGWKTDYNAMGYSTSQVHMWMSVCVCMCACFYTVLCWRQNVRALDIPV